MLPLLLVLGSHRAPSPQTFLGCTACLSSGRETTCELMMHQHERGAAAGSFSCIPPCVLAVLVGTTSQLRRPLCGSRGVKGALERSAPETRQPWLCPGVRARQACKFNKPSPPRSGVEIILCQAGPGGGGRAGELQLPRFQPPALNFTATGSGPHGAAQILGGTGGHAAESTLSFPSYSYC